MAAYLGQVELVRLLLQAQWALDLPDDEGNTALHYAALGVRPGQSARGLGLQVQPAGTSPLLLPLLPGTSLRLPGVLLSLGCGANALE